MIQYKTVHLSLPVGSGLSEADLRKELKAFAQHILKTYDETIVRAEITPMEDRGDVLPSLYS